MTETETLQFIVRAMVLAGSVAFICLLVQGTPWWQRFKESRRERREAASRAAKDRRISADDPPPKWMLQLAMRGFDCRVIADTPNAVVTDAGYAVCAGRHVEPGGRCQACGSALMRRLGETMFTSPRAANTAAWFAFCCDDCGNVARYANANYGFLGIWLGHNGNMFDVIKALEPHMGLSGYGMMEAALRTRADGHAKQARLFTGMADELKDVALHHGDPSDKGGKVLDFHRFRRKNRKKPGKGDKRW